MGSTMGSTYRPADSIGAANAPVELEQLLKWIGVKVYKNAIRLRDFFIDSDKLRKGIVPRAKFRSAMGMAGLSLEEVAFRVLEAHFDAPGAKDSVNYAEFLKQVEMTEEYAASSPPHVLPTPMMLTPATTQKRAGFGNLAATKNVTAILEDVQQRIGARRVNIKPYFQDFDKIHKERVTRAQFASVMDKMQLSLPPAEMDLLMATFADPRGDVDYIGFCNTVDPAY
uniref:EF-hand domain-containing protein n=1 Tax=Eutreptiella gymnastica TaxID=73025 RepID=A0A7S1IMW0_9EUGL|mmetsp:Transcript_30436/g.54671  ORF Transcript_30436/g.54671 Transcript_30436/m.54671 type:complete len:226 (+) Transcript_30436:1-678(+)